LKMPQMCERGCRGKHLNTGGRVGEKQTDKKRKTRRRRLKKGHTGEGGTTDSKRND